MSDPVTRSMNIISSIPALRERLSREQRIAVAPTMGNLHEGHLALVDLAQRRCDFVVATIFVNRLQFAANEDFSRYPRTFDDDCAKLEQRKVDVLFAPGESELYAEPQTVFVEPPAANELCGAFRPGHFRGVATVVAKLFNIVRPQVAVFGKKDYQQLHIIRALTAQLSFPIEIVAGETVRAHDGLALSSRNRYLSAQERSEAPGLYRNLVRIQHEFDSGRRDFEDLATAAEMDLEAHGWKVDYVAIRNRETLQAPAEGDSSLVILTAARLGKTRLIDNLEIGKPIRIESSSNSAR